MSNTINNANIVYSINGAKQIPEFGKTYLLPDLDLFFMTHNLKPKYFSPFINAKYAPGKIAIHVTYENKDMWFIMNGYFASERTFKLVDIDFGLWKTLPEVSE